MNPLIESCINLAQAGNKGEMSYLAPYQSQSLQNLGKYLLNSNGQSENGMLGVRQTHSSRRLVICFGAGIDSYLALWNALDKQSKTPMYESITLLHLDYGQPFCLRERLVMQKIQDAFKSKIQTPIRKDVETFCGDSWVSFYVKTIRSIVKPDTDLSWENYIIPARNLVIAAAASEFGDDIEIIATKRSDETVGTPDKTSRFFTQASYVLTEFYGRRIQVTSPFLNLSKLETVKRYLAMGGTREALKETTSCYSETSSDLSHCGKCYACYKRYKLFQELDIAYSFIHHPAKAPNFTEYEERERAKRG